MVGNLEFEETVEKTMMELTLRVKIQILNTLNGMISYYEIKLELKNETDKVTKEFLREIEEQKDDLDDLDGEEDDKKPEPLDCSKEAQKKSNICEYIFEALNDDRDGDENHTE